jgi:hypothetical protein
VTVFGYLLVEAADALVEPVGLCGAVTLAQLLPGAFALGLEARAVRSGCKGVGTVETHEKRKCERAGE